MIKTTVYLDEEMALALRQLANAAGRSQSEIIRDAVTRYVGQTTHSLLKGIGAHNSGHSDISTCAEELLNAAVRERQWP